MTPEAKVNAAIVKRLKSLKADGIPLWFAKTHGGPMQRAGLPDWDIIVAGRSVRLEAKAPGGTASRLQVATMKQLEAAGAVTAVVTTADDVEKIVRSVAANPRPSAS